MYFANVIQGRIQEFALGGRLPSPLLPSALLPSPFLPSLPPLPFTLEVGPHARGLGAL